MDWKKLWKKLIYPPIWIIIVLTIVSAVALTYVFIADLKESYAAYVIYTLSFYTLSVVCVLVAKVLPKKYRKIKQTIYDNPIGNRFMTDMAFRTHISLYFSLGVNLLYAGVNILSFLLYKSMWFVVLSGYYIILAIMRFLLVRFVRTVGIGRNMLEELKSSRLCSSILLTLNFVLSGTVMMILYQDKSFEYHGMLIYVMAGYTFYITINAVINLFKYRRYKSPVMTTTKIINLSAALVSMLSLETAMFSQFGADMDVKSKRLMIALTGAVVSITIIAASLYMIIRSVMEIRKRSNKDGNSE